MKVLSLGVAIDATADEPQAGVAADETPFLPGRDCVLFVLKNGVTGTPTILFQTSPDNDDATWTTIATMTSLTPQMLNVKCGAYNRINVTEVGTAGTITAGLVNGA